MDFVDLKKAGWPSYKIFKMMYDFPPKNSLILNFLCQLFTWLKHYVLEASSDFILKCILFGTPMKNSHSQSQASDCM
jgi:hypothetical protein